MQSALHATTLLLVLALLGCAGHTPIHVSTGGAGAAHTSAFDADAAPAEAENDTWRQWLTAPGQAGVDFDPRRIAVIFNAAATIPPTMDALRLPAGQRAADQPNGLLRENARFERITDYLAANYGLSIRQQVYWGKANFASFDLPEGLDGAALLARLNSAYPGLIERAYYDRLAQPAWTPTDPDYFDSNQYGGVLWGIKLTNCAEGWDYTRGDQSVRVAVVDSGVRHTHEELAATVLSPDDLAGEIPEGFTLDIANGDNTVEDLSGHGTMCAGAVAAAANGNTIIGVAPDCRVIPVKVNNNGTFPWTDGYAGIVLGHLLGARVISCSWGHYGGFDNQELTIINQVTDGGSLVLGAAGNESSTSSHYPSDFDRVVAVGASDPWDVRSSFSNYGDAVDIAAPGQWMKRARHETDSSYSDDGGGTSYACPLVAGAAALLFSLDPELTPADVKALLETTGDPVAGFGEGVLRLNVGAAIAELAAVHVSIPYQPTKLVHAGVVSITAEVAGEADRVDCLLNGSVVDSKTAAPWDFAIDTSGIEFGLARIEFIGHQGTDTSSAEISLVVDNSAGAFPVVEGFEDPSRAVVPLDIKDYDPAVLDAVRTFGDMGVYWTPAEVAAGGPGAWSTTTADAYEGLNAMYCGQDGNTYGGLELDVLVSRRIDLTQAEDPTMVFHHHFNIQRRANIRDRGWIYVTADHGQTFAPAILRSGEEALFSGYQADWSTVEVDLSEYAGQLVHVVLAFESNKNTAGEEDGQPAGWWVDDISIATGYQEHPPAIGAVSVPPYSLYGNVAQATELLVDVTDPYNVERVRFVLDCVPLGSLELYDSEVEKDVLPYRAVLTVPGEVPNQVANLQVFYYNIDGVSGPPRNIPVYVFNQLGDTNADGVVDQSDIDGYPARLGLTSADAGYLPFYDSDLDGLITEADAGMVGYQFGSGAS